MTRWLLLNVGQQEHESVWPVSVEVFEAERPRLRAIAYRIVGNPDDADDVVQETWLRFSRARADELRNPPAWLTTVASRLAIDSLRASTRRRETYVGPWLPEPIDNEQAVHVEPDSALLLAESLTLGFMSVLERVSPLERAVFILHDVFAYPLDDVAAIIERKPAATRQLAKRARDNIEAGRPRFAPDPADIEALTNLMLGAALNGDVETLESFLAEDIVHISDGGPNYRAARAPIVGQARVGRFFLNLAKRWEPGMEAHMVRANGQLAMYLTNNGEPFSLMVTNWVDGKIAASFAVRNADKLESFHRAWIAGRSN